MSQQQVEKHKVSEKQQEEAAAVDRDVVPEHKERTPEQQELLDASDDLMDEIDAALSGLDTETATTFRQKGGE